MSVPMKKKTSTKKQEEKLKTKISEETNDTTILKHSCLNCGTTNQSLFYKSFNKYNKSGLLPYCKECIKNEIYPEMLLRNNNNENLAIHSLCQFLNIPYIHEAYEASIKNLNNPDSSITNANNDKTSEILVVAYFKNLNSLKVKNGWGDTYFDSQGINKIEGLVTAEEIIRVERAKKAANSNVQKEEFDEIEYDTDYLIYKWGNFPPEELAYLESEYLDWKDKLGKFIYDKSTEINVKLVCHQLLKIRKMNELGEKTKDEINSLQNLMRSSGLLEKQDANSKAQLVVGMEIQEIERHRPIKPVNAALNDVDGYRRQLECFTGAMCRALGKTNEFTEAFDKYMGEYALDIMEEYGGET